MKKVIGLVLAASATASIALAVDPVSIDDGVGILIDSSDGGCGTLILNADGTYENGYAWSYNGIAPPYYGAFSECYTGPVEICSIVTDLTQTGNQVGQTLDLYVWDDDGGVPGTVIQSEIGIDPGVVALWPSISRHVIAFETDCIPDAFHVGWWGNWPVTVNGWFVAADTDGAGGCALTNIAPGIGFPTGWQDVDIVWPGTQAIGIGAEVLECSTPIEESTWGRVKSLFQ